jgi:hypothetical protein
MHNNDMRQYIQLSRKSAEEAAAGDIASMYALIERMKVDGGVLPKFRCFPDPFGSGVFEKTATGEEVMCPCCGV